jgi:hypothetical protein
MGATRESNWSGGILADWACEVDVGVAACCEVGMYANVSPDRTPTMQMLTSRDWRAVPSRFGCIGTSPLDGFLINASIPGIIFGHLASGLCLLLQQRQVKTAGRLVIFVGRFAGGLQFLHAISHHNQHVPTLGQIDFVPQRAMPWHDLGVVVGQGQNFVGGDNHPVDFSAGAGVLKGVKIGGAYNKTYFNLEDRRIFFNGGGTEYWAFGGMGQ